ncbi:MAG: hypothetical protein JW779_08795 [Candidatus Thorarchaeota archaeon]|nr:hypothetical protein [Candidatus Thorarchaeota archaeon]
MEIRKTTLEQYDAMKMCVGALYGLASIFAETEKMQHVEATIYKIAAEIDCYLDEMIKKN